MTAVIMSKIGQVAVLTLDRPNTLNAINGEIVEELNVALDTVESGDVVAVVITGAGRAFCAGADLKEPLADPNKRVADMHALVLRLANSAKVSVAALNGLAFGGGLELAMACTFRVAAPEALFALPEAKVLKAFPGYGGTQLLPRLVGETLALEMLLTGDAIDAERAQRIGLVNSIAEDCVATAVGLAERASVVGPSTTALVRKVVREGLSMTLADGLKLEAAAARQASSSPETRAAMAAFADKGSASLRQVALKPN